ncbi:MAG: indole-3-glycerol phosphate synthase TrpC [Capnocytophaga sp.]|nr:indole-3-glycerol phosphate synthase TrpC [Capnocytophaga sp.]
MTILDRIVADKYKEINLKKSIIPISQLEKSVLFNREIYSLVANLRNSSTGIIAEHKRRSPSKSVINQNLNCFELVDAYAKAGVSGISVLTDGKYFGGSLDDLLVARATCQLPILRKDFVIDEYQIYEAKSYGADVILLIAAALTRSQIKELVAVAKALHLEVLLEVHNQEELEKAMMPELDMLGVNNRDLKTFEVSLDVSKSLSQQIPDDFVKVSESGISKIENILELKKYGYQGFLIGENFMKTDAIYSQTKEFIQQLKS